MLQTQSKAVADSVRAVVQEAFDPGWSRVFNLPALVAAGLRVLGAVAVALLAFWALKLALRRIERSLGDPGSGPLSLHEQRARTLVGLLRSVGRVIIVVLLVFMVLAALGVNLGPLLAGAGVIGLAISFGAQSLVKDVISGLFILIENQFGVGDVIRIEGVSGAVERMTLRVVVLRDTQGVVHIIPNGEIKKVSNLTRTWARVVLDIPVAYREDPDRVMEVMRAAGRELWEDPDWRPLLVDPVEVPGIESVASGVVTIRMWAKTLPLKQWEVARELRRRLKLRFDQAGIEIPTANPTISWGDGPHLPAMASAAAASAPGGAATAPPSSTPVPGDDDDGTAQAM